MTGPAVPADDGLRERLLEAICRCLGEDPATADPAEVDDLMRHLIPVVRAYAEQRAAEELLDVAEALRLCSITAADASAERSDAYGHASRQCTERAAVLSAAHTEEPGQ